MTRGAEGEVTGPQVAPPIRFRFHRDMGLSRHGFALAVLSTLTLATASAFAQTWSDGQTRPYVGEIIALDATGEAGWLFGVEDVSGDGSTFLPAEQSIDLRSAYATTAPSKLWVRGYVSSPDALAGNAALYVFVNADVDPMTGGRADEGVDAAFTDDPTLGGYEYAFAVRGDGTIAGIWAWDADALAWTADTTPNPSEAAGESEVDVDPILVDVDAHAYLQATINLDRLGLVESCDALLYLRTLDSDTGDGDADAGLVSPCRPVDADNDGVPDIVVPDDPCSGDDDCPFNGVCLDGTCIFADPCNDAGDCAADETCNDGRCVAVPGGSCSDSTDCSGLVCDQGSCVPCTLGGDTCGAGFVCSPDGRCIDEGGGAGGGGVSLDPGDVVRGGPCACSAVGRVDGSLHWLAALGLVLAGARRMSRGEKVRA